MRLESERKLDWHTYMMQRAEAAAAAISFLTVDAAGFLPVDRKYRIVVSVSLSSPPVRIVGQGCGASAKAARRQGILPGSQRSRRRLQSHRGSRRRQPSKQVARLLRTIAKNWISDYHHSVAGTSPGPGP